MVKARAKKTQPQANSLKIRHFLAAIVAAVAIAAGIVGWQWARYADWGPALTRMVVRGDFKRVDPVTVRAAVRPHLGGGFFRVDLDAIRAAVIALPWVSDAAVRLEWPSTLKVDLREQRAVARWNGDSLVNADGVRFAHQVPADLSDLPRLAGPDDSAADVLAQWRTMAARLRDDSLTLAGLTLDARGAWRARLGSGLELRLGRDHAADNLLRFVQVVPRVLGTRLAEAAYIDLRYTNGFAVGWKPDSENEGKIHA
ncbi:MAG TPA: cell division protein FtsQ/DivIB [Gammaproteobacteria bacterium]|jgi:cell division protein FtsQ|nr:cell division protein FtsQ/DivIB [Gammaproteobacteria bacterium]